MGVRCECERERMFCNYCAQCISRTDRVQPPTLHPAFPEPRTGKYQRTRPTVCHNLYLFSKVKGINYIFDLDLPGGVSHFLSDVWRGGGIQGGENRHINGLRAAWTQAAEEMKERGRGKKDEKIRDLERVYKVQHHLAALSSQVLSRLKVTET